ncbi:hypothetical protein [Bacillus glycinifermentans]|uniref:hypothetical protein n=1 Tax=Bacillus glycinifermentans TaxID=1664069 RepID=UPI000BC323BD|nr:hypothetical protein [Bacillus glycinifermentans]ATH91716.1 hypothetical protein COP00_03065 [Bacillus glycinifermentans]
MTETKKYVRILKAGESSFWYTDKIGEVFEVVREDGTDYEVLRGCRIGYYVSKEDAELIVTEERPAKVGEKVLILDDFNEPKYMLHDEVPVIVGGDKHGVAVRKLGEWPIYLNHEQYEVIVNNEVKNEEANEMNKMLVDQAKTVFERKDDKYFGYKSRLGDIVIGGAYSYAFVVHYAKTNEDVVIIPGDVNTVTTPVCTTEEERLWKPEKTAQERRDEIVEQAKADVERLRTNNRLWRTFDITFDINRENRTVEAIAKKVFSRTAFYGTAICAPDDCFNEHIGKAIALHRALGLEVPDEYLNAPQPTEVRVGDVVECGSLKDVRHVKVVADGEYIGTGLDKAVISSITVKHRLIRIIDDSRTEVGE